MAKQNKARYQEDDSLSALAKSMRTARKLTGIKQAEFGKHIGISRETVVHIEGLYENTLLSLECEILKRWYSTCSGKVSVEIQSELYDAIQNYLFPAGHPDESSLERKI